MFLYFSIFPESQINLQNSSHFKHNIFHIHEMIFSEAHSMHVAFISAQCFPGMLIAMPPENTEGELILLPWFDIRKN